MPEGTLVGSGRSLTLFLASLARARTPRVQGSPASGAAQRLRAAPIGKTMAELPQPHRDLGFRVLTILLRRHPEEDNDDNDDVREPVH